MGKLDTLNGYIKECEEALTTEIPIGLAARIVAAYGGEIKNIDNLLTYYYASSASSKDIERLRGILINHRDNIEMEEAKELRELEKLKLQSTINISNNNNSNATATASVSISVSLTNTLERLQALPTSTISEEDKEVLEEKLSALQVALDSKNSEKAKSKLSSILRYLGDKTIETAITVLPYIGTVSQYLASV